MHIVALTGAGISAESGINTFRDSDGLWENHDVMEVASIDGWHKNKELVLEFYNQRRRALKNSVPNKAHLLLKELENQHQVSIITQNVDNLHERAGSISITHLHGELTKARSSNNPDQIIDIEYNDIHLGDLSKDGSQLRPNIVWFGENVPMIETASKITEKADLVLIIGTSLNVYPAAGLVNYAKPNIPIYLIDPKPIKVNYKNFEQIAEVATIGMTKFMEIIK